MSLHDANAVAQFDAATGKEMARLPVGLHPYHMARDPGGLYLYVTIYDEERHRGRGHAGRAGCGEGEDR